MRCSPLKKAETWIDPNLVNWNLFLAFFLLGFSQRGTTARGEHFFQACVPVILTCVFQSRFLFTSFSNASVFFLNCCYVFNLGMGIGFQAKGTVVILFTVTCSYSCISYRCMILMITPRQIECIVNTYALEYILACSIYRFPTG
jgi:hypothetical protein